MAGPKSERNVLGYFQRFDKEGFLAGRLIYFANILRNVVRLLGTAIHQLRPVSKRITL